MGKNENLSLDEIKKEYDILKNKYKLPEYSDLNRLFDLEGLETSTKEFLLRKIRRIISETTGNYLRFLETLLNPTNAPAFFFKLLRKMDPKDKENLGDIYERIGKMEIKIIQLDLDYNEAKEAEFIKLSYEVFDKEIKKQLLEIIERFAKEGNSVSKEYTKSYFG
jgi:hypothetical protein